MERWGYRAARCVGGLSGMDGACTKAKRSHGAAALGRINGVTSTLVNGEGPYQYLPENTLHLRTLTRPPDKHPTAAEML